MPWNETNAMELGKQFIRDVKLEVRSVKDLCATYGMGRQTGYSWIERYQQHGLAAPMHSGWQRWCPAPLQGSLQGACRRATATFYATR